MRKLLILLLALFMAGCAAPADPDVTLEADTPRPTATVKRVTATPADTPVPTSTPRPTNTPQPTPTCPERDGGVFMGQLDNVLLRWEDAIRIADSTGRINLAGPVGELQEIRRETMAIDVPQCAHHAQDSLVYHMESVIDGFLAFMAQESDATVTRHFRDADDYFSDFLEELVKIRGGS